MLIAPQQPGAPPDTNVFAPTGLNDQARVNLIEQGPFLAIDPRNPHEIDDAIRVRRHKSGGFLVEVAIADGAQIDPNSQLLQTALKNRNNRYSENGEVTRSILPPSVVWTLELAEGIQRALVITKAFSRDGEPLDGVGLVPALVELQTTDYASFIRKYFERPIIDRDTPPIIALDRLIRNPGQRKQRELRSLGGELKNKAYGERVVATYMIVANMAVASLMNEERSIPFIYRDFNADEEDLERGACRPMPVRAVYTTEPLGHSGIVRGETPLYTHVTSPLRRAADLIDHMQLGHKLAGKEAPFNSSDLASFAASLSTHDPRELVA